MRWPFRVMVGQGVDREPGTRLGGELTISRMMNEFELFLGRC